LVGVVFGTSSRLVNDLPDLIVLNILNPFLF